jgi:hypothetical protein
MVSSLQQPRDERSAKIFSHSRQCARDIAPKSSVKVEGFCMTRIVANRVQGRIEDVTTLLLFDVT